MSVLGLKNLAPSLSEALNDLLLAASQFEAASFPDLPPQIFQVAPPAHPGKLLHHSRPDEIGYTGDLFSFCSQYFFIDIDWKCKVTRLVSISPCLPILLHEFQFELRF